MLKVRVKWHGSKCKKRAKRWNFSFNQSSQPEERAKLARLLVHLQTFTVVYLYNAIELLQQICRRG